MNWNQKSCSKSCCKRTKNCECEMNWKVNTVNKANKHEIYYKLKQK